VRALTPSFRHKRDFGREKTNKQFFHIPVLTPQIFVTAFELKN